MITPYIGSCSTFQLQRGDDLIVGHNFEDKYEVSGAIIINQRDEERRAISWAELCADKTAPISPPTWRSKYASASFNTRGAGFSDGGLNEAGLAIWEMSLFPVDQYAVDVSRPTIFMMNWIQLQLDMHEHVEQVIKSASAFNLDGWFWHFFVADRYGRCATIEFVDGKLDVHEGSDLPVNVLCNARYSMELDKYKGETHRPEEPSDFEEKFWRDHRFKTAAEMIDDFSDEVPAKIVDYGFNILDRIVSYDWCQWQIIVEPRKSLIHYRTKLNRNVRSFRFDSFDLSSQSNSKILDINAGAEGDVASEFTELDYVANRAYVERDIRGICDGYPPFKQWIESQGSTVEQVIESMAIYPFSLETKDFDQGSDNCDK
ncbi:hypothetical protein VDG1235_3010 [Verrucomicrobiia bacterium DG1235]|nr:hypothetical protein VDG1235_3010 [Verrucomicrobiae bacterium DG1235]